jgi:hypothetical protein
VHALTSPDFYPSRNQRQVHPSSKDQVEVVAEDLEAADEGPRGALAEAVAEVEAADSQEVGTVAEVEAEASVVVVVAVAVSQEADVVVEASVADAVATKNSLRQRVLPRHDHDGRGYPFFLGYWNVRAFYRYHLIICGVEEFDGTNVQYLTVFQAVVNSRKQCK